MTEHTGHPGEYRPFGADTVWCPTCDRPLDRTRETECAEHQATLDELL